MQLRFSRKAQSELSNIATDGILRFGQKRSDLYLAAIQETLGYVQTFPELGKVPFPFKAPNVRRIRSGMHMIYYRHENDLIFVECFLHVHADETRLRHRFGR